MLCKYDFSIQLLCMEIFPGFAQWKHIGGNQNEMKKNRQGVFFAKNQIVNNDTVEIWFTLLVAYAETKLAYAIFASVRRKAWLNLE